MFLPRPIHPYYFHADIIWWDGPFNVGDIRHRHRHLLFWHWRQICWTENHHSDIGSFPISTSEFIPISDIEEKKKIMPPSGFEPTPLGILNEHYKSKLWCLSDIGQNFILISDIVSDSALSVRYRKFRYQAQSDIADHGYRIRPTYGDSPQWE